MDEVGGSEEGGKWDQLDGHKKSSSKGRVNTPHPVPVPCPLKPQFTEPESSTPQRAKGRVKYPTPPRDAGQGRQGDKGRDEEGVRVQLPPRGTGGSSAVHVPAASSLCPVPYWIAPCSSCPPPRGDPGTNPWPRTPHPALGSPSHSPGQRGWTQHLLPKPDSVLEHGIPSEQQRAAPTGSTAAWAGRTVASAAQEAGRHGAGGVWWGSTCCSSMARRSFCRTAKLTSGSPLIAESSSWYRLTMSMPCPKPQFLSWGNECLPAWKGSSWVEGVVSQQPPPPSSSFLPKITVPVLGGQEPSCPEGFL